MKNLQQNKNRCKWLLAAILVSAILCISGCGRKEQAAEPFYEYYDPDGSLRLMLYYDPKTGEGRGVRYYEQEPGMFAESGIYEFAFEGISEEEWNGTEIPDYLALTSVDGTSGAESAENYKDNYEYDEDGRLVHFDSEGVLTWLKDTDEVVKLLWMDFEYHENGELKHRYYYHDPYEFSTYSTTRDSYFDERGRLVYEDIYVTHGSMDYYYIYEGDEPVPAYCLILDFNVGNWLPELVRYTDHR